LPDIGADETVSCGGRSPTIAGSIVDDVINGTSGPDVILALGGADTISGLGGEDRICGGEGNDTINGGTGNDQLFGGPGDDTLNGVDNTDTCDFGGGQVSGTATLCETVTNTMSGFSESWAGDVTQTCDESQEDLICTIEGTLEVENPGVDTAEQSLLRFFLSFDELLDEWDVLIQETLVDPLEPQEVVEVILEEQLPPNQDAIGQFIIALLDATDVVSEINEENNVVVSSAIIGDVDSEGVSSGGCSIARSSTPTSIPLYLLIPAFVVVRRLLKRHRIN